MPGRDQGRGVGGYAYDVGYGAPNRARFRIQGAIPAGTEMPVSPGTEYYAFKVNISRATATGTGACAGCSTPVTIRLNEIQLFQPAQRNFDPILTSPIHRAFVRWQGNELAPWIASFSPAGGAPGQATPHKDAAHGMRDQPSPSPQKDQKQ